LLAELISSLRLADLGHKSQKVIIMKKIDFIRFSLEDGSFVFDFTGTEDVFFLNPIMDDDLYIEFFFHAVAADTAKLAFLDSIQSFISAAIQANKRCENVFDCNYSDNDIEIIKEKAEKGVAAFRAALSKRSAGK
jgi:hypothetical protein